MNRVFLCDRWRRSVIKRVCKWCDTEFWTRLVEVRNGYGNFCSKSCNMSYTDSCKDQRGSKNPNWKGGISKNAIIYKNRSVAKYPERDAARKLVAKAIRSGILIRLPCEVDTCGDSKSESHHEDYSKPLEVKWLCRSHHRYADALRREREKSQIVDISEMSSIGDILRK